MAFLNRELIMIIREIMMKTSKLSPVKYHWKLDKLVRIIRLIMFSLKKM